MEKALVGNAADPKQVKAAARKERIIENEELRDIRFILKSKEGRRFLWRYLSKCGIFKQSFTGNSETFFNEGKRAIGLMLLTEITEASPDAYVLMMKESEKGDYSV